MPQAIGDPVDLERFSHNLKAFNNQLRQSCSQLNSQFKNLGSTWRDQEHHKFAQEFLQTIKVIQNFLQIADEHIPFLQKKAMRLNEYLNQR